MTCRRVFSFLLGCQLLAGAAAGYSAELSGISAGGGAGSSGSYTGIAVIGSPAAGTAASPGYTTIAGTGVIIVTVGTNPPMVSDLRVDGTPVLNNDYVKNNGTLTAVVSSDAGLDLIASSLEVDGAATSFAALSGGSSYDADSKLLIYKLALSADGAHPLVLHAADNAGNSTTLSLTLKVDSGDLKAVAVYCYPNPYNPAAGSARIAYQLNRDADTSLYIFNSVGELLYKRDYPGGSIGGLTGYNEVAWDGKSDFGGVVGNDIYFLRVVSGGKPVGKTKIAVLK
ncbi:MAG: hypothetical protein WC529_00505 [Candidatus Margulisiibacteriota bacterium]